MVLSRETKNKENLQPTHLSAWNAAFGYNLGNLENYWPVISDYATYINRIGVRIKHGDFRQNHNAGWRMSALHNRVSLKGKTSATCLAVNLYYQSDCNECYLWRVSIFKWLLSKLWYTFWLFLLYNTEIDRQNVDCMCNSKRGLQCSIFRYTYLPTGPGMLLNKNGRFYNVLTTLSYAIDSHMFQIMWWDNDQCRNKRFRIGDWYLGEHAAG